VACNAATFIGGQAFVLERYIRYECEPAVGYLADNNGRSDSFDGKRRLNTYKHTCEFAPLVNDGAPILPNRMGGTAHQIGNIAQR
jgi:hypothetical protein